MSNVTSRHQPSTLLKHTIVESNYTNNTATVPITIPADYSTGDPTRDCVQGSGPEPPWDQWRRTESRKNRTRECGDSDAN